MHPRLSAILVLLAAVLAVLSAAAPTQAEDARTGAAAWVKAPTWYARITSMLRVAVASTTPRRDLVDIRPDEEI